ncbi:MAG: hypothetical protein KAT76_01850 [Bacteroidales bacterium]|nr:hypothetical protein [Bacteroidales bacterium]
MKLTPAGANLTMHAGWGHGYENLGHSTSKISDALGHKTEDVTRAYLDYFNNEELDMMNEGILG